jgi:AP-2 complex subunit beta-1
MVVNVFIRDIRTGSPIIKALGVRTIGYLKVEKLNEYLIEPLKQSVTDEDPYVRKTAVLAIPKLYEISPQLIEDNNIIKIMQSMLNTEGNSYVLSNLIQALSELS